MSMNEIHKYDVKLKEYLTIYHDILVKLTKKGVIKKEELPGDIDDASICTHLANIFKIHKDKIHSKCFSERHRQGERVFGTSSIDINALDITDHCTILLYKPLNLLTQIDRNCCKNCNHVCNHNLNGSEYNDHNPVQCNDKKHKCCCGKQNTPDGERMECCFAILKDFVTMTQVLRNTYSHILHKNYQMLEDKVSMRLGIWKVDSDWEGFTNSLKQIVDKCLKAMKELDVITAEEKGGFEERLRKADKMKELKHWELQLLREMANRETNPDVFYHNNNPINYGYPHERKSMMLAQKNVQKCTFDCDLRDDHIELINVQFLVQDESTIGAWQWQTVSEKKRAIKNQYLEINDLPCEKNLKIRALFYQTSEKKYFVASIEWKLTDDPASNFEIDGKTYIKTRNQQRKVDDGNIERTVFGLIVTFPDECRAYQLKLVRYNNQKQKEWESEKKYQFENLKFTIDNLPKSRPYNFQFIFLGAKDIHVWYIDEINIADKHDLAHVQNNFTMGLLAICHPMGKKNDLHKIIKSDFTSTCQVPVMTNIMYYKGGSTSASLTGANNYLQQNFHNEIEAKHQIVFPPDENPIQGETMKTTVIKRIQDFYRHNKKSCIIFTDYQTKKHLNHVAEDFNKIDIGNVMEDDSNRLLVLDEDYPAIFNIRIHDSDCNGSLQQCLVQSHEDLKTLFILHWDLCWENKFSFLGMVVTNLEKKEQDTCQVCSQDLVIYEKDLKEKKFREKWKGIRKALTSELDKRDMSRSNKSGKIFEVANRMMVMISLETDLPCPFGNSNENIDTLIWNKDQLPVVKDSSNRKIITGSYGCGKSYVGHKILEDAATNGKILGKIFVITWDPYSLMYVEHNEICNKLKRKAKAGLEIIATDIVQLTKDAKKDKELSLTECLEFIAENFPETQVHFFLDEFHHTSLVNEDLMKLQRFLSNDRHKDSLFTLILKSFRFSLDSEKEAMNVVAKLSTEMKLFKHHSLHVSMRFTKKIHNLVNKTQDFITMNEDISVITIPNASVKSDDNASELEKETNSINVGEQSVCGQSQKDDTKDTKQQQENQEKLSKDRTNSNVQARFNIFKLARESELSSDDEHQKVQASFYYEKAEYCGTGVNGSRPEWFAIEEPKYMVSSISAMFNQTFGSLKQAQSLCICFGRDTANIVCRSLHEADIDVIEYLYYTDCELNYPTSEKKREIYQVWKTNPNCVLVTDNAGSCGLEHENVFVFLSNEEKYERHSIPEALSRSTSRLTVISLSVNSDNQGLEEQSSFKLLQEIFDTDEPEYLEYEEPKAYQIGERKKKISRQEVRSWIPQIRRKKIPSTSSDEGEKMYANFSKLIKDGKNEKLLELCKQSQLENDFGNSLLHVAAQHNNSFAVNILIQNGCDVTVANEDGGWTAYHWAVSKKSVDALRKIIELDKDKRGINLTNHSNETPLHVAARVDCSDCVELLLDAGINVNIRAFIKGADNEEKKRADEIDGVSKEIKRMIKAHRMKSGGSFEREEDSTAMYSFLADLIRKKQLEPFKDRIGNDKNLAILVNHFGNSLLHIAAQFNVPGIAEILILNGCDETIKNKDGGWTAYHWAARENSVQTLKKMIELRPNGLQITNQSNESPLHTAAKANNKDIVLLLLNNGADVNVKAYVKDSEDDEKSQKTADELKGVNQDIKDLIKSYRKT